MASIFEMICRPIGFKHQDVYEWKPTHDCAASPTKQDSCGNSGRIAERESPNTRHKANRHEFLPKLQKRFLFPALRHLVPQWFAKQTMCNHTATDGTTTLQESDTKHCLDLLESCIGDLSSRICSQGLPETLVGLHNGEHLRGE